MKSELRFHGFYATGPVPWEDWHAGVRMHGIHFHYMRFYSDGTWFSCYRDEPFAFWQFNESVGTEWKIKLADGGGAKQLPCGDLEFQAGNYVVAGDQLLLTERSKIAEDLKWEFAYHIRGTNVIPNDARVRAIFRFVRRREGR